MSHAPKRRWAGTEAAAGDGRHGPPPVREAELPLRERGGAPRAGGPQLLRGQPDAAAHPAGRARRTGAPGDGPLSTGAGSSRDGGERRSRRAGERPAPPLSGEPGSGGPFAASIKLCFGIVSFLEASEAGGLTHQELECRLDADSRELTRQLFQDHLDLRAEREQPVAPVVDSGGVEHRFVEPGHRRLLETIFGEVTVTRLAYRAKDKGAENLHIQDAALNLPRELHSHGLRQLAAVEATRGSYEEAQAAVERGTGQALGKRQVEELARRAAADVEGFYGEVARAPAEDTDVLVISADGKGIVMRPEGLRPATRKAAEVSAHKLQTRLTRGEKKDRKRMAELTVVYDCSPVPREPSGILARREDGPKPIAPVAKAKWLTASIVEDAKDVIKAAFDEAERRDPGHLRPWVAIVDGAKHQIDVIKAEATRRGIDVPIVVDLIHVLEYLWGAARCFYAETDPVGEAFVAEKALAILEGKAGIVAGAIRRKATMLGLDAHARKKADECASYLKHKQPYLDYPTALASGWPIATGVIEGAVRHVCRDRMDVTGARWSVDGAEAVLKLRAVRANGDWAAYWRYHLAEERTRVHGTRYAGGVIPLAA